MAVTHGPAGGTAAGGDPADIPLLGLGTLDRVPAASRPLIRPGDVGAGIVHLGLGAFHRAHQAVYTERAIAAAGGDWGIIGVAPRSVDVVRRLADQDGLFSVTTLSAAGAQAKVVGACRTPPATRRRSWRCWPTRRSGWSR
jgi:fructuronate reductase